MLVAALVAIAAVAAPAQVRLEDYYPLEPGMRWVYEDTVGTIVSTVIDTVQAPVESSRGTLIPVSTTVDGQEVDTAYYQVRGEQVLLAGFNLQKLMARPYPVFVGGSERGEWRYEGETMYFDAPAPLVMKGTVRRSRERDVLGKRLKVVEVRMDGTVGTGPAAIKSEQTAWYAEGIGLVEMIEKQTINRKTTVRNRKLVDFSKEAPPSPAE